MAFHRKGLVACHLLIEELLMAYLLVLDVHVTRGIAH